jgi:primase-polymerase (primpol)-like protein
LSPVGVPTRAAAEFLAACPDTYVEISPSGDGLHVWGLLPEGPGRKQTIGRLSVETYSRDRFITVTGKPFRGAVSRLGDLSGAMF